MARLSKKGALALTKDMDKVASAIQEAYALLGIPQKYAADFVRKSDVLADRIWMTAGIDRKALTGDPDLLPQKFNPQDIDEEKAGPLEKEPDEPYMNAEFTQQERRELSDAVESGQIGPDKTKDEEASPRPGIQASFNLGRRLSAAYHGVQGDTKKMVNLHPNDRARLAKALGDMGQSLLVVQANVLAGKAGKAAKVLEAVSKVIPHIAGVTPKTAPQLYRMANLVTKFAAEDEPEGDEKDEPEGDEKKDEGKEAKKASVHGYDLFA